MIDVTNYSNVDRLCYRNPEILVKLGMTGGYRTLLAASASVS